MLFVSLILFMAAFVLFTTISPALASSGLDDAKEGLGQAARYGGFTSDAEGPTSPVDLASKIIKTILGFVGTIFLILIIVSGFQWMTAGGNEETIKKARGRMTSAVIGLAIILGAWVITDFVINSIVSL